MEIEFQGGGHYIEASLCGAESFGTFAKLVDRKHPSGHGIDHIRADS
jgi:hypothetical protein